MNNAEWMIQNGMKFSKLSSWYLGGRNIVCYDSKNLYEEESSVVQKNVITKWLDMEHKEQILDDTEKRYLKGVIRPFRDRVKYIAKICVDHLDSAPDYYICIRFNDGNYDMNFPFFDESHMYKCMEINRPYTLEELGL